MTDLSEGAEEMAQEREESRAKWSRYLDASQWPQEVAAKTRWIGKDEAMAMYPMDNGE